MSLKTRVSRKEGVLIVEAAIGVALLMFAFMGLFRLGVMMWQQLKVEEQANLLARDASRTSQAAGTTLEQSVMDGQGTADVAWGDEYVVVRVAANDGTVSAQRVLPREVR